MADDLNAMLDAAASKPFKMVPTEDLVETLAGVTETYLAQGEMEEDMEKGELPYTPFDMKHKIAPVIDLRAYVQRLKKYFYCSPECFLVAYVLIDRLVDKFRDRFRIASYSMHRMLLTALMTAAKMRDDKFYTNRYYAQVGGISVTELNFLECYFLNMLDWNIHVSLEHYRAYQTELEAVWQQTVGAVFNYAASVGPTSTTQNTTVGTGVTTIRSTLVIEVSTTAMNPSIGSFMSVQGSPGGAPSEATSLAAISEDGSPAHVAASDTASVGDDDDGGADIPASQNDMDMDDESDDGEAGIDVDVAPPVWF
eukprot:Hpha_TRINITY_DN16348_c0_g1::TRINITY_DN16348_c0_g1_i3::g.59308::m.59308